MKEIPPLEVHVVTWKYFGSVVLHNEAFTSAAEAMQFCIKENERIKRPDFQRCDFTTLRVKR